MPFRLFTGVLNLFAPSPARAARVRVAWKEQSMNAQIRDALQGVKAELADSPLVEVTFPGAEL